MLQPSQAAPSPQLFNPDRNLNTQLPVVRAYLASLRIAANVAERITQAAIQFAARIAARQAARQLASDYII